MPKTRTFYKIIPNPLVSLTHEKVVELNRWLNTMTFGDCTWGDAMIEYANAYSMKNYIVKQNPSLEYYMVICPLPPGVL